MDDIIKRVKNKTIELEIINEYILKYQYDDKIEEFINELINIQYKFDVEYLYRNVNLKNKWIKLILDITPEEETNILYKFLDNPKKFDEIMTELKIDPNNEYNFIGVLPFTDCGKNLNYSDLIICYNLVLKHGFKFPNFLSFLLTYVYCISNIKETILCLGYHLNIQCNDIIRTYKKRSSQSLEDVYNEMQIQNKFYYKFDKYNILTEHKNYINFNYHKSCKVVDIITDTELISYLYNNSIKNDIIEKILKKEYLESPKEVSYNDKLFNDIYSNPYKIFDYDEFNRHIVDNVICLDDNVFFEYLNELKKKYSKNKKNIVLCKFNDNFYNTIFNTEDLGDFYIKEAKSIMLYTFDKLKIDYNL